MNILIKRKTKLKHTWILLLFKHGITNKNLLNIQFMAIVFVNFGIAHSLIPYRWKKRWKVANFFSGDQYFSPTNNFTRLKLKPTQNFYQLYFLLNKFHYCLNFCAWNRKRLKKWKILLFSLSVQTSHSRCGWSVTLTIVVKKKKPPRWI